MQFDHSHPRLFRTWRMSSANQRHERPLLSNERPESKPVDCSSYCRFMNCSLQLQRDCCSLQSCCRQETISLRAVYSAGAPNTLPNVSSLAGVCSRVHLRGSWGLRLRGVSLDIGDSFDRETESSDAGTGQSAGTGRKVHFYQEDKIKLQVHQPKYKCTTRRFLCLR